MNITFLGVRGSTPCGGTNYQLFGGHTSCIMVEVDNLTILFDAGSGIIDANVKRDESFILFSHAHLDHIMGLPFYKPIWEAEHKVNLFSGNLPQGIESLIERLFSAPIFPVSINQHGINNHFFDFRPRKTLNLSNSVTVKTIGLNHHNGAIGYRLEYKDKSLCYITDVEHKPGVINQDLVNFIQNTDLFIYDSTYEDENFHPGYGHSTWQEGVRLAQAAKVKQLAFFHHSYKNVDTKMLKLEDKASKAFSSSFFARQGMVLDL